MVRFSFLAVLFFLQFSLGDAFAGTVTGKIHNPDGSKLKDAVITVKSGDKVVATSRTNNEGEYSIYISQNGSFRLCVEYKDATPTPCTQITSTRSPKNYTLEIYQRSEQWRLRKKR